MATVPLILTGYCKIGADSGSAVDLSDAITHLVIKGSAEKVEIPATLSTPKTSRKGAVTYSLEINYLSNDVASTELFRVFWAAITGATGQLYFEAAMRDGAISTSNPKWSGNFIVTEAALGGDAQNLSDDSVTFDLTDVPTLAFS